MERRQALEKLLERFKHVFKRAMAELIRHLV